MNQSQITKGKIKLYEIFDYSEKVFFSNISIDLTIFENNHLN